MKGANWNLLESMKLEEEQNIPHSIGSKEIYPRKIMVGWTYKKDEILILTVYEVKRRWK